MKQPPTYENRRLTIKQWSVQDRPREKYARNGASSLSDAELLAILLRTGNTIGMYVGNELAGKTVKVKSSKLTVTLHSDNDKSQGWGFKITRIRSVNQAILKMPFEAIKKKRRTP